MSSQKNSVTLPIPAKQLLAHRSPMLCVDSLIARTADRATGLATLPEFSPFLSKGIIIPEYFIEVIAQTSAMANGYDALCEDNEIADGMLVGIESFSFPTIATPGHLIHVVIEKTFEFGTISVIRGKVLQHNLLLAQGDIKVWENSE